MDPSAPRNLYLIEGKLDDIARYAGDIIDWIIRVSNLICGPSGKGDIYTEGKPSYWYERDRDSDADWQKSPWATPSTQEFMNLWLLTPSHSLKSVNAIAKLIQKRMLMMNLCILRIISTES